MPIRLVRAVVLAAAALAVASVAAQAHPHVWVVIKSEVVYAPDGKVTGVRHAWTFDDMFSAFAVQGLELKNAQAPTREELAPLAKINAESLKEFDYFTFAAIDGGKVKLKDPLPDYHLTYDDARLTLHFTLPFAKPVRTKALKVEVYDPTIFVSFEFAKDNPVQLVGAPKGCEIKSELPREMTWAEGKALSQIPPDQKNTSMAWGANFANKIAVACP